MSRPDLIGTVLAGRYKIIGLIGEGGMGSVYLGEQIAMSRKTAIKILHTDDHDNAAIARFRRGSRNAARIDHPNVCRIFEYGDPPGGLHFLAMEFIEGESIHDLMTRRGPIQLGRATRIIEQTVEALHAAHSLGIVHRDLKPANIMLTRGVGGEELVKVVDFDIAKAPSDTGDEEITQLDWMVGTPLYMSPEQFNAQSLDKRSDIYSLAIVLFRMISGSFPFSATTSPWAIMAERMTSPPRPLSQAAPDLVFPPKLQEVLDRALQLDPDERWPSVLEFGEALHEAVGDWVDEEEPLEEESPETESLEGPWGGVSLPEEPTLAASESELEHPDLAETAAAADAVDVQIPETEVAPKPPLPGPKEHVPNPPGSSASRLRRATMVMAAIFGLGGSAWGVYTAFIGDPRSAPGGPEAPPPVSFAEGAEERLSGFEQQFESFAQDDVPVAVAEAADSVARLIYDQSAGIPDLQARAASVRARALGYLDDSAGAVTWARQAVDLAPESQQYRTALGRYRMALGGAEPPLVVVDLPGVEDGPTVSDPPGDPDPRTGAPVTPTPVSFAENAEQRLSGFELQFESFAGDNVPVAVAEAADSVATRIYNQSAGIPDLQAHAASVRARARGYLRDFAGAILWAQQAVDLAPGSQRYRTALAPAEAALDGYRLSEIQDEFDSYLLRPDGVPDAVAEAADSVAGLVFERNADRPVLQATGAFLRAQALGYLDDWRGAVTWAQRAVDLAPGNQEYQRVLESARENLERIPQATP